MDTYKYTLCVVRGGGEDRSTQTGQRRDGVSGASVYTDGTHTYRFALQFQSVLAAERECAPLVKTCKESTSLLALSLARSLAHSTLLSTLSPPHLGVWASVWCSGFRCQNGAEEGRRQRRQRVHRRHAHLYVWDYLRDELGMVYRGTSLIKNKHTLGPYSRTMHKALRWVPSVYTCIPTARTPTGIPRS